MALHMMTSQVASRLSYQVSRGSRALAPTPCTSLHTTSQACKSKKEAPYDENNIFLETKFMVNAPKIVKQVHEDMKDRRPSPGRYFCLFGIAIFMGYCGYMETFYHSPKPVINPDSTDKS